MTQDTNAINSTANEADSEILTEIRGALRLAQLLVEKCELGASEEVYLKALKLSQAAGELRASMEAIAGLLRLSSEALDKPAIERWTQELDRLMVENPNHVPPMVWYCHGAIARHNLEFRKARRYFLNYLKKVRSETQWENVGSLLTHEESIARAWTMLAVCHQECGKPRRAQFLAEELLRRYEHKNVRVVKGILYLLLGNLAESGHSLDQALAWYQKAHASFLAEHNWHYHLYVLCAYAQVARQQQNYAQAYWYLDLLDKATSSPGFGVLRRVLSLERSRLEQDAVDLLIDSRKGMIKTRESGQISLRKQYVLISILEALSSAHGKLGEDRDRGLSKAEIIERVWNEHYRPEAHDNKLYYNINRLRKLIEPDMKKPQYLLNWREGYRLAPGLKIQLVGGDKKHETV